MVISGTAGKLLAAFLLGGPMRLNMAGKMVGLSRAGGYRALAELERLGVLEKHTSGRNPTYGISLSLMCSARPRSSDTEGVEQEKDALRNLDNNNSYYYKEQNPDPPVARHPPSIPGAGGVGQMKATTAFVPLSETIPLSETNFVPLSETVSPSETNGSAIVPLSETNASDPDILLDQLLAADRLEGGEPTANASSPYVAKRREQTRLLQHLYGSLFPLFTPLNHEGAALLLRAANNQSYLVGLALLETRERGPRITRPVPYAKKAIESQISKGWSSPNATTQETADPGELSEPTPEYLRLLAETQAMASLLWGNEDA